MQNCSRRHILIERFLLKINDDYFGTYYPRYCYTDFFAQHYEKILVFQDLFLPLVLFRHNFFGIIIASGVCAVTERKRLGFGLFKPISEPFLLVGKNPNPPV